MRLKVDKENDALYLRIDEANIAESEEVEPGIILDFNKMGSVVGVEFLQLSKRGSLQDISQFHYETV